MQYCDKVIEKCYPKMADNAEMTCINSLAMESDKVALTKINPDWQMIEDRSMVIFWYRKNRCGIYYIIMHVRFQLTRLIAQKVWILH